MFKGKKILFFSANFFGYQTEIKNKLVALGAEVDFFDERPTNTFLYKSLIRFDKRIIRMPIENYYRDIISKTKIIDYDFVLFITTLTTKTGPHKTQIEPPLLLPIK